MNYKDFKIIKNGQTIQIKDINDKMVYWSGVYTNDEAEVYAIGQKIIDTAMTLLEENDGNLKNAFRAIGELDENNQFTPYTKADKEKDCKRKKAVRKTYTRMVTLRFIIDLLIYVLVLLCTIFMFSENLLTLITFESIVVFVSLLGMIMSLFKKDNYSLSEFLSEIFFLVWIIAMIGNKRYLQGPGEKIIVAGPASRYVLPLVLFCRPLSLLMSIALISELDNMLWLYIIVTFKNIVLFFYDIKTNKIVNTYQEIPVSLDDEI